MVHAKCRRIRRGYGSARIDPHWIAWGRRDRRHTRDEAMPLRNSLLAVVCFACAGSALGARIYVTTPEPVIGSGACSLQEAIYSSVLHDTIDGAHGIAIDATDQGDPPDQFITTG